MAPRPHLIQPGEGLGRTLRDALRPDVDRVAPVVGAVTALPVIAVFVVGLAAGDTRAAVSMAIGANLIAVTSLVGAPRLPIGMAVRDAAGMGVAVFVGSATVPRLWLHVVLLAACCFAAGMAVAFGQVQATIGTHAVIAFVVLGRFSGSAGQDLVLAGLVVAGAAAEIAALPLLRLPSSLRVQRAGLAAALDALAAQAARPAEHPTTAAAAALDHAARTLSPVSLFLRTDVRDLRGLLDQARRIRLELAVLAGLRLRLSAAGDAAGRTAVDDCLAEAADQLLGIGQAVRRPGPAAVPGEESRARFAAQVDDLDRSRAPGDLIVSGCVDHLAALGGELRAAASLARHAARGTSEPAPAVGRRTAPRSPAPAAARRDLTVVADNLHHDSPALRHAVRLAVAVPASALVASWLALPRGYWVPFAVAVVLKPDYSSMLQRGLGRVVGTLLGATLGAVVVSTLHPGPVGTTVLVALTAWAAYSTWSVSFAVAIGFVTALVLVLLSTSLPDGVHTAFDRLVDVIVGGAVAWVSYLVWPTAPHADAGRAQSELFAAQRDYLCAVLDLVKQEPVAPSSVSDRSRSARLAWTKAEAVVARSLHEPSPSRPDPQRERGMLAAALRVVRALHALRTEAERGATVAPFVQLDQLQQGLASALGALADRLAGGPTGPLPTLRPRFRAAARVLAGWGAPPSIAVHLDELVNAIDTAADLVGLLQLPPEATNPARG